MVTSPPLPIDRPASQPASQPRESNPIPSLTGLDARQTNISPTTPLIAFHNHRRPINLLRIRSAEQGRRSPTVLAEVEIDIDIWERHNKQSATKSDSNFIPLIPPQHLQNPAVMNGRNKGKSHSPSACEQSGFFPSSGHRLLTLTTISLAPGKSGESFQQTPQAPLGPEPGEPL